MTDPTTPASGMTTLRAGLDLSRASQLTMLRLQLALHTSNRRTAMQALDDLLDIDAAMEGLAAGLTTAPSADAAALSGFIGLQKAALAMEKHALAGGDWRHDARSVAQVDAGADLLPQPTPADEAAPPADVDTPSVEDEAEGERRPGGRHWLRALVAAIVLMLIGAVVIAWLRPDLLDALRGLSGVAWINRM